MGIKLKENIGKISLPIVIGGQEINMPSFTYDFTTPESTFLAITSILNFIIGLSAVVAVIMIIFGGYTLIMSNGDPENTSKGGKIITAAVVGMVVVFIAKLIITFVVKEFLL